MADFEQIEALYIYEASLCSQCGRPLDECRNADAGVMVDDEICRYSAAVEVARRTLAAKHQRDKPAPGKPYWSDGLMFSPRPMTDDETAKYSGRQRTDADPETPERSRRAPS